MFGNSRLKIPSLAGFPISGIVLELKRKKFKRQFVKVVMARLPRRIPQEREKAGGKV